MGSRRRVFAVVVASTAVAAGVAGCGSNGDVSTTQGTAGQLMTASVGYLPIADEAVVKIGDAHGIFEKHGLKLTYGNTAPTGTGVIAQLLNGQIDIGLFAFTSVMTAANSKIPIKVISGMSEDYKLNGATGIATLVPAESSITSFKQLAGKTVGVNSLQGVWEIITREAIAKAGGNPSEAKLVAIPFADQVAALQAGRVDAITSSQPFIGQLLAKGYKNLGDPQAIATDNQAPVIVAASMSAEKLTKDPQMAKAWVAGLSEAAKYANAHPDEVRKMIISETKASADVINSSPVPQYSAALSPQTVDAFNKLLVKYGIMKSDVPRDEVMWSGAPSS